MIRHPKKRKGNSVLVNQTISIESSHGHPYSLQRVEDRHTARLAGSMSANLDAYMLDFSIASSVPTRIIAFDRPQAKLSGYILGG